MKLSVTATFVAQYNLAIVVGHDRRAGGDRYGYDSEEPYGSISYNSTGMTIIRLYAYISQSGSSNSSIRVQSGPSFPKTVRRLDNGTSVTFTANSIVIQGVALFKESDVNKTVYLTVS